MSTRPLKWVKKILIRKRIAYQVLRPNQTRSRLAKLDTQWSYKRPWDRSSKFKTGQKVSKWESLDLWDNEGINLGRNLGL